MDRITAFRGEHAFLSNFHPAPVVLDGEIYRSVEHAYQAAHFLETAPELADGCVPHLVGDVEGQTLRPCPLDRLTDPTGLGLTAAKKLADRLNARIAAL